MKSYEKSLQLKGISLLAIMIATTFLGLSPTSNAEPLWEYSIEFYFYNARSSGTL